MIGFFLNQTKYLLNYQIHCLNMTRAHILAGSLLLLRVFLWSPKRLHLVSTPFKSLQGDYERLLENIQTLSRTFTISGSICHLRVILHDFGVLPWVQRGLVEEALFLNLLRGSMRD